MKHALLAFVLCVSLAATADTFFFSTGNPDGRMAVTSRPDAGGNLETEAADDFLLTGQTKITSASFYGLLTGASPSVGQVSAEIYRVFPNDSNPPSGNVPTRVNSPSDVALDSRDANGGTLSFTTTSLGSFTAGNSVLNGINKIPNQTTGGEGAITGTEVLFTITFTTPFTLDADHYFFVPQVQVTGGEFYWLSAPKPIVPPGTPFMPDLQMWVRNANLDPDWLRVGTDIVGGSAAPTFNGAFTLSGETVAPVPEPSSLALLATGAVGIWRRRTHRP